MENMKEFIDKALKEDIILQGPVGSGKGMYPTTIHPAAANKPCSIYFKK